MNLNKNYLQRELYSRYGNITRARGCFLYTQKCVRLTDLYQEGGRAILGWGGGTAFTMLKNTLNRGISGTFETGFLYRNQKAVSELFNSERKVFFYNNYEKALKASLLISKEGTNTYRPWSNTPEFWQNIPSIVFMPPLPWAQDLFLVCAKKELLADETLLELLPEEDFVPAPLLAAITRSVYDLISELPQRQEKNFFIYDTVITKYWRREGPYLFPKVPEEKYRNFVLHCLDCKLVISPDYNKPSIVPFGADAGNFTMLKNKPFEF